MTGLLGLIPPGPRLFPQPFASNGVWYRKITGATVATDTDPTTGRSYAENMRLQMSMTNTADPNGVYGLSAIGSLAGGPNKSGDGKPVFIVPTPDHPRQPVFHFGSFPSPPLGALPTSWVQGQTYKGIGALTGVNGTPGALTQGTTVLSLQVDSLQQSISGAGQDIYVLSTDGKTVDHYTSAAAVSAGQTSIPINNNPVASASYQPGSFVFHNPFSGFIQYYLQSVPVPVGLDASNKLSFSSPAFQQAHLDRVIASGGTDSAMTIWDPFHDEVWEFAKFWAGNVMGTLGTNSGASGALQTGTPLTSIFMNLTYPLPVGTYILRDTADTTTDIISVTAPATAGNQVAVSIASHTFAFAFATGALVGAAPFTTMGTLNGTLATGTPLTSITTAPLPAAGIASGTYTIRDTAGAFPTEKITVTANAAAGATSITISSHTFNSAFPTGSLIGYSNQIPWTDTAHVSPPAGYVSPFNDGWYYACANAAYWGPNLVTFGAGASTITGVAPSLSTYGGPRCAPALPYLSQNQDGNKNVNESWGCTAIDAVREGGRIDAMDVKLGRITHALKIFGQCGGPNGPSGVATALQADNNGHPQVAASPSGQPTTRWDSTGTVQTQGAQQLFSNGPQLNGTLSGSTSSIPVNNWPASYGQVGGPNYSGALSGTISSIPIVQLKCPIGGIPASPTTTISGVPPTFPTGTVFVKNAFGFPPIGSGTVAGIGTISWTGVNTTQNKLTGVTGGSGTPAANAQVTGLYTITDGVNTDTFSTTALVPDGATSAPIVPKTFSFAFLSGATLAWPAILGNTAGRMSQAGGGGSGTPFTLRTVATGAGPNGNSSINNGDATIAIQTKTLNFTTGAFVEISDLRYECPEGTWYRLDPAYILPSVPDTFGQNSGTKYPELAGNLGNDPIPSAYIDPIHIMYWQAMRDYGFFLSDGGAPSTFTGWDINTADTPYEVTTSADWNARVTALAPNSIASNSSAIGSQVFVWIAGSTNNANQKNPCWTGPWLPAPASRFSDGRIAAATTLSGAQTLPEGTVTVASTAGFPAQGFLFIVGGTGAVTYTGISGNTFTGCYGGTGSPADGAAVTQGYSCVQQVVWGTW